jgi:hypothetical protein
VGMTYPSSHGVRSKRAVVDTSSGEISVALYSQKRGPLADQARLYVHNVDRTWTVIQVDTNGNVVATAHARTRNDCYQLLRQLLRARVGSQPGKREAQ